MTVAVVIGATGGIGSAVSDRLAQDGFDVFRASRSGGDAFCDVTDQEQVEATFALANARGYLSVLVNAWGDAPLIGPSTVIAPDDFARVIEVDLIGLFRVCRQARKYMSRGGQIVNVSSIHAIQTYPERAAYAAAKAGVVGLTQALAVEWGQHGVTVNCVLPGQVDSPRSTRLGLDMAAILRRSPMRSIPDCADVAAAVSFLCSPGAEHINGHSLVIDGGWSKDGYWAH